MFALQLVMAFIVIFWLSLLFYKKRHRLQNNELMDHLATDLAHGQWHGPVCYHVCFRRVVTGKAETKVWRKVTRRQWVRVYRGLAESQENKKSEVERNKTITPSWEWVHLFVPIRVQNRRFVECLKTWEDSFAIHFKQCLILSVDHLLIVDHSLPVCISVSNFTTKAN